MKWFNNMKIVGKLIMSFIIVALIAGIIGSIGIVNIKGINNNDKVLYQNMTLPISKLAEISELYQRQRVILRDVLLLQKTEDKNKQVENIKGKDIEIEKLITECEKLIQTDKNAMALLETLKKLRTDYMPYREKVIEFSLAKNEAQAIFTLQRQDTDDAEMAVQNAITNLENYEVESAKMQSENNENTTNEAVKLMVIFIVVGMVLAVLLGLFISKVISKPILRLMDAADKLSNGDIDIKLEINTKDEVGSLANAFEKIIVAISDLTSDANSLAEAAIEGKLSTRADASKHHGEYRRIVEGVNATLDAVIHPLNEAEQVMKKMSFNDYTTEITGQYKGVLGEFTDSINSVRARLLSVQDAIVRVSKGDTSRLEEFRKIGKRSENDQLMPSVTGMMETIKNLIQEAGKLATSAVNGDLSTRGNAGKFEGGYKEIIEGMNMTMDAVSQPLEEAAAVMNQMEQGNLTVSMNGEYRGEYAKIKEALNYTIKTFNDVLNEINSAAQQVASGSRQISDSAQALSQGSTEQASSVEELTASLEEISAQTKQNAVNATQADELAIAAKENAVQGNEQMLGMLKAMEEINESSSNISKIIKVIDEIAFQTNILALNAAVEAARAGQHGKGFAVVAEEVRNLAARSANAAKETTGLIEGSIKKAEGGTKIANETALALNRIVDGIAKAASLVGEIASASNEQASAIAQINQGIMQVSQVTQTNSATSEESAAASEELSSQAELLNEMVGKFKLKKSNTMIKNLEELNPEVLKMLENMSEKKKYASTQKGEAVATKLNIALSDSEFGKY